MCAHTAFTGLCTGISIYVHMLCLYDDNDINDHHKDTFSSPTQQIYRFYDHLIAPQVQVPKRQHAEPFTGEG